LSGSAGFDIAQRIPITDFSTVPVAIYGLDRLTTPALHYVCLNYKYLKTFRHNKKIWCIKGLSFAIKYIKMNSEKSLQSESEILLRN